MERYVKIKNLKDILIIKKSLCIFDINEITNDELLHQIRFTKLYYFIQSALNIEIENRRLLYL